jgi:hypothetical protein
VRICIVRCGVRCVVPCPPIQTINSVQSMANQGVLSLSNAVNVTVNGLAGARFFVNGTGIAHCTLHIPHSALLFCCSAALLMGLALDYCGAAALLTASFSLCV